MDSCFGVCGKGFAILATDRSAARSILVFKHDEDKIAVLNRHKILAAAGENSDRVAFTEYVKSNLALQKYRSELDLSTAATASWIRTSLAQYLRKRPYQVNLLLAGHDKDEGASLYFIDYMGTKQKTNFAAHGYCSNFVLSIMDRHWKEDLTVDEAIEIIQKCIRELQTRFMLSQKAFMVKIVDGDGHRVISLGGGGAGGSGSE